MSTAVYDATRATTAAISARGLRKSFGEKTALDGIDLTVPPGTILALLGPNGAGKTTAVHLLTTYLRPDAGEIRIVGQDPAKNPQAVRRAIGVTGQFSAVDGYLTGRENLMLMADLHLLPKGAGRRRAEELLERFELTEAGDKPVSTYSGGMKRKLDLAMTLVGNPKVIFLDEPTTGLDPRSRRTMWDIIRGLVAEGTTILLTTQYLEEAVQDRDAVRELVGLFQVLGGEQDGRAGRGQLADDVPHRAPAARVKAGGRLVEEDHLRVADQGHRQVELALHAAGVG